MKTLIRTFMLLFFIFTLTGLFLTQEGRAAHELFDDMDRDHDGGVTLEEFRENMEERAFQKIDSDDDDVIALKEWESFENGSEKGKHFELFERMDRDKDRRISFSEFSDYADRKSNLDEAFMGLDKDGSNSLSQDEISVRPMFRLITIRLW